jgi:hypothetical protein
MGIVNVFLHDWFGIRIGRAQSPDATNKATTTCAIGSIFERDTLRQQSESYYFNKRLAPPRNTYGVSEFNQFLKNGTATPPHDELVSKRSRFGTA